MNYLMTYIANNKEFYDTEGIMEIIGLNKSKLQRVMKKTSLKPIQYKNKLLYDLDDINLLMEFILNEKMNDEK
jgi:hypothetical protein